MNVVCIKWGQKYGAEYVNNLDYMVRKHSTVPTNFICITEDTTGIKDSITIKELPNLNLKIWWNKLYIFKPGALPEGPTLYLDLDVVIHRNIDEILTYGEDDEFVGCRDFGQPKMWFNSSVMRFNPKSHSHIWDRFDADRGEALKLHGDQNFITKVMKGKPGTITFPDEWIWSYKWGAVRGERFKKGNIAATSKIAVFHGIPNPPTVKDKENWIKENWKCD
jgi:hypothetical protein